MEYIYEFSNAFYVLSAAMSIYILIGLLFAGILHELVSDELVTKHLGNDSIFSVIKATLFGIPLPVCSCGVIPLATSMKKSGASNGATLSFLISTPITGIDAILATFGMFGWVFTIYRVITSIIIALVSGIINNFYEAPLKQKLKFTEQKPLLHSSCCENQPKHSFSMMKALEYGFVTLLGDIAKALFLGLVIGALITVFIPEDLTSLLLENQWLSYLIAIVIAVPMYVCATSSLPIAASLMLGGVSAGAAFVFLTAGPATNTVTIGVVKKMLGTRSLYIYLGSIILGSILFGLGFDWLVMSYGIDIKTMIHVKEEIGIVDLLSTLVLWALLLFFLVQPLFKKKESCCL